MTRSLACALLALALLGAGCGKYGPPQRTYRPPPPEPTEPAEAPAEAPGGDEEPAPEEKKQ